MNGESKSIRNQLRITTIKSKPSLGVEEKRNERHRLKEEYGIYRPRNYSRRQTLFHKNNLWTIADHERFLPLLKEHGRDFKTIAEQMKNKSERQCYSHALSAYYKHRTFGFEVDSAFLSILQEIYGTSWKPNERMNQCGWSQAESDQLIDLLKKHGSGNLEAVGRELAGERSVYEIE